MTPDTLPIFGVQTAIESEPGEWTIGTLAADLDADPDAVRAIVEALVYTDRVVVDVRGRLFPAAPTLRQPDARILAVVEAEPGVWTGQIAGRIPWSKSAILRAIDRLRRAGRIAPRRGTVLRNNCAVSVLRYFPIPTPETPPLDLDWIARRARDLALGRERPEEARPPGLGIRPRAERREVSRG